MSVLKSLLRLGISRELNPVITRMNLTPVYFAASKNLSTTVPVWNTEPGDLPAKTMVKGRIKSGFEKSRVPEKELSVVDLDSLSQDEDEFNFFPDENTPEALYNGIKFSELPYVNVRMHKNNTKLVARTWDQKLICAHTPAFHGFTNAKKKTAVGGQVAGSMMGQKLRSFGHRYVRVRLNGFNQARESTIKGIVQAGITIVAIQDATTVNWGWPQRAKARPSGWKPNI